MECDIRNPTDTKICKNDGEADYYKIELPKNKMYYKCKRCGHKDQKKSSSSRIKPREDALFRKSEFNRKFINRYVNGLDDGALVAEFFQSLKYEKDVSGLKEFLLLGDILQNIADETECDKGVEKSHLENVLYWFFSAFMMGNLESSPIKLVSDQSKRIVSRTLTDDAVISPNSLGELLRLSSISYCTVLG